MAESYVEAFTHLTNNYMFQTSNYALYIYDHCLTFSEEVDKIWSQPFTFASLLFYLNRYVTHAMFLIIQVEFHETNWPISVCDRYVKFAGGAQLCMVAIAELTLILRVYALYMRNKLVLAFLLIVLACQISFTGWALHFGRRVPLPPGLPGCVLTGSNEWFAAFWIAPLATDTCIVALTLWKTLNYRKGSEQFSATHLLFRDGLIYFIVIFSSNLMNAIIYFTVTEDLKAVGASFNEIITAIMISRLQLNLRGLAQRLQYNDGDPSATYVQSNTPIAFGPPSRRSENPVVHGRGKVDTFLSLGYLGTKMGRQGDFSFGDDLGDEDRAAIELNHMDSYSPAREQTWAYRKHPHAM